MIVNTEPSQYRYSLSSHTFVCTHGDEVVLLDLKQNKYLGLTGAQANSLVSLVSDWPADSATNAVGADGDIQETIHSLVTRGLLIDYDGKQRLLARARLPFAVREVCMDTECELPSITSRDVIRFLGASVFAAAALRFLALSSIVRRIHVRRARTILDCSTFNQDAAQRLVNVYGYLRPYVASKKDACLFESLSLLEFMWRAEVPLSWAFGVQTRPFCAHCWLQHGDVVVNDTVETISRFTPIMVV